MCTTTKREAIQTMHLSSNTPFLSSLSDYFRMFCRSEVLGQPGKIKNANPGGGYKAVSGSSLIHTVPFKPLRKCYSTGSLTVVTPHYNWSTPSEVQKINVKNAF